MKRDIVTTIIYCYVHHDRILLHENVTQSGYLSAYIQLKGVSDNILCMAWVGLAWLVIGEFCLCLRKKYLDLSNEYKFTYVTVVPTKPWTLEKISGMFIVSRPIRCEMKPQKITDKPQQGSVTTCYETTSWLFLLQEIFNSLWVLFGYFLPTNQHQSLDSVCSKSSLPNRPKSKCKLWKLTTVQVGVMGEGFLAPKKYTDRKPPITAN